MRLAVIPARGGSKRIPRKNIKLFCGEPIIARSINAALECSEIDRVVVSTDDPEIAEVARHYGAIVPFMRPDSLADDFTPTVPVVQHAIDWFQRQGETIESACCIYATAPFIQATDLTLGYNLMSSSQDDYAVSVTSYAFPIQRALKLNSEQRMELFYPDQANTRSQDLEEAWHDAGQWYWGSAKAWLSGVAILNTNFRPVVIPRHRVQDIDTPEDWLRAELMYQVIEKVNV